MTVFLGLDNFIVIGDVYRRDEINRTHYPAFHQLECVQLFTANELFGTSVNTPSLFEENGKRDEVKQEWHTLNATNFITIQLKECPIFSLYSAGATDKVGWAFGLGLERLAMILYDIPDIRLFWSQDSGFLSQFAGKSPEHRFKYKPVSVHPQVFFDLSFWLPDGVIPEELTANTYDLIRSVGGLLVEQVNLSDSFTNRKTGKRSQTYRIVYRSNEKALTKEEVRVVHEEIEKQMEKRFSVKVR
ncbi:hypothetical protein AB6A40_010418 [Gnathostoma spinigerum]|uniref:phenylalanine--tRNA ligase n=1 Tax=Gnathostoma spinigerum TaxID=75299 RepID=A0ABD6EZP5_9BILA